VSTPQIAGIERPITNAKWWAARPVWQGSGRTQYQPETPNSPAIVYSTPASCAEKTANRWPPHRRRR